MSWGCRNKAPHSAGLELQIVFAQLGGWWSQVKVSAGLVPSEVHQGAPAQASVRAPAGGWPSSALLGVQKRPGPLPSWSPGLPAVRASVSASPPQQDISPTELGLAGLSRVTLAMHGKVVIWNRYFAQLKAFREVARMARRTPTGPRRERLVTPASVSASLFPSLPSFLFAELLES